MVSVAIDNLPGIPATEVEKLKSEGINSNLDLLKLAKQPERLIHLAQKIGVNLKYLRKWIVLADLASLPSVGSQYCGLLLHASIISSLELSKAHAPQLHRQILRVQVANLRRRDLCPPISLIRKWIKEAQQVNSSNLNSNL